MSIDAHCHLIDGSNIGVVAVAFPPSSVLATIKAACGGPAALAASGEEASIVRRELHATLAASRGLAAV